MELLGTCSQVLVGLLNAHGVEGIYNAETGIVSLPAYDQIWMGLEVYRVNEQALTLKAVCSLGPTRAIIELLSGFGANQTEQLMDGQGNFVGCIWHVWLAGLLGKPNGFVTEHEWTMNGTKRKVFVGLPVSRGMNQQISDLIVGDAGWRTAWQASVRKQPISAEIHWATLSYVRSKGKTTGCDALLDNKPNESIRQDIEEIAWPDLGGFYSVRQFLIVAAE